MTHKRLHIAIFHRKHDAYRYAQQVRQRYEHNATQQVSVTVTKKRQRRCVVWRVQVMMYQSPHSDHLHHNTLCEQPCELGEALWSFAREVVGSDVEVERAFMVNGDDTLLHPLPLSASS